MFKDNVRPAAAAADGADGPSLQLPDVNLPEGVTSLGRTLVIKGELSAGESLIVEGRVEGQISVPDHAVAVGQHAQVSADIMARTVTVLGQTDGILTASEKVELRSTAAVTGRIVAARLAIADGARFNGSVDPTRTDAAMAVGRHRLKQRQQARTTSPS